MSLDRFEGTSDSQTPLIHLTSETGTFTVPDGSLLFGADFQRDGHDLLLINEGASSIRIEDYFLADPPAPIHAPNGSQLSGDVVARLAGPIAPAQYAQAGGAQRGGDPIGQVETIDGVATVQRADGVVETLTVGMKIFQNDVVETDASGSVSLTFADGTIFTLSSASRMVIDSLIYDPNANDNSASFSLVQGSFVFIAGQVAKTGGMDVNTPSATMGIRGTTVLVRLETINGAITTEVTLHRDDDGSVGSIQLRALDGTLIQTIEATNERWIVTTEDGETFVERTAADEDDDRAIIADAFLALQSAANRLAAGGTFVTLPSTSGAPGANGAQLPGQTESDGDVDDTDEQINNNSDEGPGTGGSDGGGGGVDEAANQSPPIFVTDVTVQGQEDAGEEGGISGSILVDSEAEGDLTFAITSGPGNGTATLNNDGTFNYIPDSDFNGTDSFTYSVTDGQGDEGTGTVFVEVEPVNDPPELEDTNASASEDGVLVGSLDAEDVDGDPLTYSLLSGPSNGTVNLLEDGSYSYVPDENFEGEDSFEVQVEDTGGATDSATVFVDVTPINDTPVIDTPDGGDTGVIEEDSEDNTVSGQLTASDPDLGDNLTWSGSQSGDYGELAVNPTTGEWTYTLDPAAADPLGAGEEVVESFEVTVEDSVGASSTTTIEVLVVGTNDPAAISGVSTGDVGEDGTQQATGTLTTSDVDAGEAELQPLTDEPGDYGTFSIDAAGAWTYSLNNDNADVQALPAGAELTDTFTVTSEDGTETQDVVITITGTNDAATISGDATGDVVEDTMLSATGTLAVSDVDTGETEVQPLSNVAGNYGTFSIDAAGNWTYTLTNDNADVQALPAGAELTDTFTVTSEDGTDTQNVVITITGSNDTADIGGTAVGGVVEDGTLSATGTLTNADPDSDQAGFQPLTAVAGTYGTFSVTAAGAWTYALANADTDVQALGDGEERTDTFTVTSQDGTDTQDVVITVTGTNDDPQVVSIVTEGEVTELEDGSEASQILSTSGLIEIFDTDSNDVLSVEVTPNGEDYFGTLTLPEDLGQSNPETGGVAAAFNWTFEVADTEIGLLAEGQTAEQAYTVTVTDALGVSVTETITITITGTNDTPVFVSDPVLVELTDPLDDSGPFASGTFQVADADVNDTVTFSSGPVTIVLRDADGNVIPNASGDEEGLQPVTLDRLENFTIFVGEDGAWEVAPGQLDLLTEDYRLELTTTITATDDSGAENASTTQEFSVTFVGTNDAPLFDDIDSEGSIDELPEDDEGEGSATLSTFGLIEVLDIDQSDVLTVSFVENGEDYFGTFSIPEDIGQFNLETTGVFASFNWDFEVSDADIAFLAASQTIEQAYDVTVTDAFGASATETVTITFTGANDEVVSTSEDLLGAVTEDDDDGESEVPVLTDGGVIGFTDADLADEHAASASFKSTSHSVQLGVLTALVSTDTTGLGLGGEVTWSFSVDNELVQFLGEGETITEVYTVSVTDNQGSTIARDVAVTITGTNDAPVIAGGSEVSGAVTEDAEDNTTSGQLSAIDPEGDTVIWGIQGSVEGTYGDLSIDATGFWTYTLDNAAADELGVSDATETFAVTFTDTVGDPTPQTIDITIDVIGNNDAPRLDDEVVFENLDGDAVVDGTLTAFDPEGEPVTFEGVSSGETVAADTSFDTAHGTVSIGLDGQFIYVPVDGYVGFDSFDYRATDASGNTTDGTATIAVESSDGTGEDSPVDVSINTNPTDVSPAGSLLIDVNEVAAPRVNVVFALDFSGSVSQTDWDNTLAEIDTALDQLLTTFGSSETQVTVGFTVFSGGATAVESFDLTHPSATDDNPDDGWADRLIDLTGQDPTGLTNWTAALNEANTFFDAQQAGASNFLFFVTDGVPTQDASDFPTARDNVENASYGADGLLQLDVRIEAFGIGPAFTGTGSSSPSQSAIDNLNALDSDRLPDTEGGDPGPGPYYTALTDPSLLAAALTESPVFNPSLVSLSVELDVSGDGSGPVEVADETSRALVADDLDYVMAFAEIENLADQLGVENRFTIRAEYDLDGNGSADLELFSTELLGRADTAQTIPNTGDAPIGLLGGSDLLFGSDEADSIASQAENDLILGYGGNDTLNAGTGIDTVLAGDGADLITLQDAPTTRPAEDGGDGELIDGGAGQDTLVFEFTNDILENALDDITIRDIETLDMTNGGETTLRLTLNDVVNMSSDANTALDGLGVGAVSDSVLVLGDGGDNLFLEDGVDGTWSRTATDRDIGDGTLIDIWQYTETGGSSTILATVGVDAGIDINPTLPPMA